MNWTRTFKYISCGLLLNFPLNAQTQIQQIEQVIQTELNTNPDPGLSVSIFYKGDYLFNKGYGHTDIDKKSQVTASTLFKNASTSKVLAALAILHLEAQGKVKLDRPIRNYVDGLKPQIGQLNLRQLLSHTSGLKDFTDDFGPGGISRQEEYARQLDKSTFFTKPEEVFSYSNSGYNVVGAVIEAVADGSFNDAMRALVFDLLDMPTSTYRLEEARNHDIAYGHSGSQGNFTVNHRIPDNALERASGNMFTTAKELNQLLAWVMTDSKNDSEQIMKDQLVQILADQSMTGSYWSYGFGLFHSKYCNERTIWHTGGMPGYSATFLAVPDKEFSIVVLSNGQNINRWNIISGAMKLLLESDCSVPANPESPLSEFSSTEMEGLVGTYTQGVGARIRVSVENGSLKMKLGNDEYDLMKNAKGQLVTIDNGEPGIAYTPKYDDSGRAKYLQYWVRAYPRIK